MMKFARLSSYLHQISRFGSRNGGFQSKLYSTEAPLSQGFANPLEGSKSELCRRICAVGHPSLSIVPVLDQWGEQGRSLDRETLRSIVNTLHHYKRYHHALEISMWMTDKRCYELTSSDFSIRMHLILKVKGIEQVERYFDSIPQELKGRDIYGSLHKCYAAAECVEKAEALMQKMRDLGFDMVAHDYNVMLIRYYKAGDMEKFNALLKEMGENGIAQDRFTLGIQLSAYAAAMDIEGMDKIVMMMECDQKLVPVFADYSVAATGYRKAGRLDKALEILMKAEALLKRKPSTIGYNQLMTQYATIGRKVDVLRVWSSYKEKYKVRNKGYSHILNSLVNLGDFERAKEIFHEWESRDDLNYDMNIPNIMIGAYSRKGIVQKAEAFLDRAMSKGGKPNAWTCYHLFEGYFQNEQPKKAVEMMKKTIGMLSGIEWEPVPEVSSLKACLKYLKGVGDTEQVEEFVKLLVDKDIISSDKLEELCTDEDERL